MMMIDDYDDDDLYHIHRLLCWMPSQETSEGVLSIHCKEYLCLADQD